MTRSPNSIENVSGVYCLWSHHLGKAVYVGSTINLGQRRRQHKYACATGLHTSDLINQHCQKYGADDLGFTVLQRCEPSQLLEKETENMEALNTHISKGGLNNRIETGQNKGCSPNFTPWNKGKAMDGEYRKRASVTTKAAMQNPEVRAKLSACKKGVPSPKKGIKTGKVALNAKVVIATHLETGAVSRYKSLREAGEILNLKFQSISSVCLGKFNSLKGYTFCYES